MQRLRRIGACADRRAWCGAPAWLSVLAKIDPLSYAVDPIRRAVFQHVRAPASFQHALNPGIAWGHWRLPVALELLKGAVRSPPTCTGRDRLDQPMPAR